MEKVWLGRYACELWLPLLPACAGLLPKAPQDIRNAQLFTLRLPLTVLAEAPVAIGWLPHAWNKPRPQPPAWALKASTSESLFRDMGAPESELARAVAMPTGAKWQKFRSGAKETLHIA